MAKSKTKQRKKGDDSKRAEEPNSDDAPSKKRGQPSDFKGARLKFLTERIPDYVAASKKKGTSAAKTEGLVAFWPKLFEEYWTRFPWRLPLKDELPGSKRTPSNAWTRAVADVKWVLGKMVSEGTSEEPADATTAAVPPTTTASAAGSNEEAPAATDPTAPPQTALRPRMQEGTRTCHAVEQHPLRVPAAKRAAAQLAPPQARVGARAEVHAAAPEAQTPAGAPSHARGTAGQPIDDRARRVPSHANFGSTIFFWYLGRARSTSGGAAQRGSDGRIVGGTEAALLAAFVAKLG
ncbi:hypothetical protein K438DRAFT_1770283 [Mycena galopus ATCC 62051]|nr:hypothetical protein K438DRAFT_1770283 [Mycena galopus ATCC 62051]